MAEYALPTAREAEDVTGNKTLDAGDGGVLQNVTADAVLSLPTIAAANLGCVYTIINGGEGETDGEIDITIRPVAADKISGYGLTSAVDKDIVNTGGKSGVDFIQLVSNGVTGGTWQVVAGRGTWTREA
jgi:hypothetical protein